MATREEIREGIKDIIVNNSGNISCLYTEPSNLLVELCLNIADDILRYEDSKGVVIRVTPSESKPTSNVILDYELQAYREILLRAGYVAVKSLIKEKDGR